MIEGKTCLITGSTSGIGKEIAIGLAKMKANVIMVGRSKAKCLDSYQSLDILINNAGVFLSRRLTTVDGIEYTFAVNHLAPFLLTNLLFERIKASNRSRIITTSSVAHTGAHINFNDLQFERARYNGLEAYRQSKLANIFFTKELGRRSRATGVTSNCFHPGGVRTNLVENSPWYYRLIWAIITPFLVSPKKGADTAIYLASSPKLDDTSGKYFVNRKPIGLSDLADDEDTAARLWRISEELTGCY